MLAIAVDIRSIPSAPLDCLTRVGIRLRCHRHVDVGADQMIVDLPNIGHAQVTESESSIVIDAVVDDELGVKRFAVALLALLHDAAGSADFRDSLTLEWRRSTEAPALPRQRM